MLLSKIVTSTQTHDIIPWKLWSSTGPGQSVLYCDAKKLGDFFFMTYLELFAEENLIYCLQNPFLHANQTRTPYTRASFAIFLAFVRKRVDTNWSKAINYFLKAVVADHSLLMGPHNYQDLLCHLYMHGAYDEMESFHRSLLICQGGRQYDAYFFSWRNIPPYVCVVLKMPRSSLKVVERMNPAQIRVPMLHCLTIYDHGKLSNIHSVFQPIFGNFSISNISGEPRVVSNEDSKGWDGDSSLIVTFYMASWILRSAPPESIQIGLHFRITPTTVRDIIPTLGPMLKIYATTSGYSTSSERSRRARTT